MKESISVRMFNQSVNISVLTNGITTNGTLFANSTLLIASVYAVVTENKRDSNHLFFYVNAQRAIFCQNYVKYRTYKQFRPNLICSIKVYFESTVLDPRSVQRNNRLFSFYKRRNIDRINLTNCRLIYFHRQKLRAIPEDHNYGIIPIIIIMM